LVKKYGGKVVGAPSSKTSYVVLGADAGPKKLETIATPVKTNDNPARQFSSPTGISLVPVIAGSRLCCAPNLDKPESKELQDIFDSIPTIDAPEPPQGEPKKFKFAILLHQLRTLFATEGFQNTGENKRQPSKAVFFPNLRQHSYD
jgi:hypothetical protein